MFFEIILYLIVVIGIGLFFCFCGRRYFYTMLSISGFIIGFSLGQVLFETQALCFVYSLCVGAVLAILARFVYAAGLFLMGAGFGALLGIDIQYLCRSFMPTWVSKTIIIVLMVLLGVVAVMLKDVFIIVSTSGTGASLIGTYVCFIILKPGMIGTFSNSSKGVQDMVNYINNDFIISNGTIVGIVILVVFFIGVIYQFITCKGIESTVKTRGV